MIMSITLEQIRRFLGRPLQDPYGRTFGKVVGINANLKDEITGVGIEVGNGEFVQCPGDRVTISADTLVLAPTWKVEAEEFRKEFDVVTRRLRIPLKARLIQFHRPSACDPDTSSRPKPRSICSKPVEGPGHGPSCTRDLGGFVACLEASRKRSTLFL